MTDTFPRCRAGASVREACAGLVEDLHERWELPSVYLLVDGRLRCQASRGYFQVSDGFPTSVGVMGKVIQTGRPVVIPDVTLVPEFIAAIPGLRSEAGIPVRVGGQVAGVVNLESRSVLDDEAVAVLEQAAVVLGERIDELGGLPAPLLAERLGRIAVTLAGQTDATAIERIAVAAAREISAMGTAALLHLVEGRWVLGHAEGPLAPLVAAWDQEQLSVLCGWLWSGTSSYFPDGEAVPPGYEFLGHGIHALAVQPLVVGGQVQGMLLSADAEPAEHNTGLAAALELLATHTAATLAMVRTLEQFARQAETDPLTGLVNRRKLLDCVQVDVEEQADSALVLIDLDGFKTVNDVHGHAEGDAVLQAVARRLQAGARSLDVVCRLGGDEFAVLVRGVSSEAAARAVAQRFLEAITSSDDGAWHPAVGASAGVRLVRGSTTASLLTDADAALYAAKHRGRAQCVVWEPALRQQQLDQGVLVEDLRAALRNDELHVVYQPLVDTTTMQVMGVEALARWHHPRRGVVPPKVFVDAAERAGVVGELTRWVLGTVTAQAAQWPAWLKVGLNVSAAQLTAEGIVHDVQRALITSRLDPARLVLEVTETSAMGDLPRAKRTLEALSELGLVLALDDFGTGHSSLTHAHALPYDILKVDRSFVAAAARGDKRATALVAAVTALGERLGVDVVAEGVESPEALAVLTELGCRYAQGHGLSRPLQAAAVTALLAAPGGWTAGRALTAVPLPRAEERLSALR